MKTEMEKEAWYGERGTFCCSVTRELNRKRTNLYTFKRDWCADQPEVASTRLGSAQINHDAVLVDPEFSRYIFGGVLWTRILVFHPKIKAFQSLELKFYLIILRHLSKHIHKRSNTHGSLIHRRGLAA